MKISILNVYTQERIALVLPYSKHHPVPYPADVPPYHVLTTRPPKNLATRPTTGLGNRLNRVFLIKKIQTTYFFVIRFLQPLPAVFYPNNKLTVFFRSCFFLPWCFFFP